MGTRHSQMVINKEGEVKLRQYGQWDGYPSGQGLKVLQFLRNSNLEKYYEEVNKLREITDDEAKEINKLENWSVEYPYLSRDCGSNIHQMIENGEVKFVSIESTYWCEGFYTIDFQKNTFEAEFHGTLKTYKLDKLPTEKKFLKDFKES